MMRNDPFACLPVILFLVFNLVCLPAEAPAKSNATDDTSKTVPAKFPSGESTIRKSPASGSALPAGRRKGLNVRNRGLAVQRIFLQGGTIRVTIAKAGSEKIPVADYPRIRLELVVEENKAPTGWPMTKVDPGRRLAMGAGTLTFDTNVKLEKGGRITAALSGDVWKTSRTEILSFSRAMPPSEVRGLEPLPARMRAEGRLPAGPSTEVKGKTIFPKGVAKASAGGSGLAALLPRGGEYMLPGGTAAVSWRASGEDPGNEGNYVITLLKGTEENVIEVVYSGPARSEEAVWVDLPRGLEEGYDYLFRVDKTGEPGEHFCVTNWFTIGPPIDTETAPREDFRLELVEGPGSGATVNHGARLFLRWRGVPETLLLPERYTLRLRGVSGGAETWEREYEGWGLGLDPRDRTFYAMLMVAESVTPGQYRLEVVHHYDELDGSDFNGDVQGAGQVFTLAAAPEGPGVTLLYPQRGVTYFSGESVPFRWEIPPGFLAAYGPINSTRIQVYDADEDAPLETVSVDPELREYNLPTEESLPGGDYKAYIRVSFAGSAGFPLVAEVAPIQISTGALLFTWPSRPMTLNHGVDYLLSWSARGNVAHRDILVQLMQGETVVATLTTGVPASAERWLYETDIHCNSLPVVHQGTGFAFRLVSDGGHSYTATSDSVDIVLPKPLFNRGSPRAGETWPRGSNRQVLWSSDPVFEGTTLTIELRKGGELEAVVATGLSTMEGYWEWPSVGHLMGGRDLPDGEDYRFRLKLESCDRIVADSPVFAIGP
jgi:hypothetical protein